MALTAVDKVKINKYLKEHAIDDIYYLEMCDFLGKRGKISDIEFLEYFTDYTINEFNKDCKISIKHLTKVVSTAESFLVWAHQEGSEIPEDILDKIRNFENFYEEYLEKTGNKLDEEFKEKCLGSIVAAVNELYPCEQTESMTRYINQIKELNGNIKGLKKQLSELNKQYELLQTASNQKTDKIELLSKDLVAATGELQSKEKQLSKLEEVISSLNTRITELETSLQETQQENANLRPYQEQYESLTTEVKSLKEIIAANTKEKNNQAARQIKESKIEALIYQKILFEKATVEEIVRFIETQKLATDKNEVVNLLKRIRNQINIESNSFSLSPTFKVAHPNLLRNTKFTIDIPNGCKSYDIMLVSDFHLEQFDHKILTGFDMLNDYCVKNGIKLILNLGDFFHGSTGKPLEYDNAKENYHILEQSISLIPKVDGIYHAVLGGNHDRSIAKYGFDPISCLAQEREDFISLGYKHSTINLMNANQILGCFDLHHPDRFEFPIDLEDGAINTREINEYLIGIYEKQNRNREESYLDMLGHTHKSQYNYAGSYCFIPPFFDGKNKRGACHLRIYFDEDINLECMVLMPLSIGTKLVKNNEIIHQKILHK